MEKPEVPQKAPYVVDCEPKKYFWCTCGKSQGQPYCDGAHKGSGMKSLMVEITEPKKVAWCGCKQTKNPPYCDGSHSKL